MFKNTTYPVAFLPRENNFNLVRHLAAFFVFFSHCYPLSNLDNHEPLRALSLSLGSVGVDIFFILSGFLVSQSFVANPSWLAYLRNRLLRLLPALTLMVLLSIFILGPLVTDLELFDYFSSKTTHRYFRNILLLKTHRDLPGVFSNQDPSAINGSLWTLLYEVRFYFLAPFLVWLFYRARKIAIGSFIVLALSFFTSKFLYPSCGYSPLHE